MTSVVTRSLPSPVSRTLVAPEPVAPAPGARSARTSGSSFTALTQRVNELGLMRRRYGYYWAKMIGAVVVLGGWTAGFVLLGDSWWQLVSAVVLAVVLTQGAFLGHDAAHRQIFASGRWNDWASLVLANLFVGISYGWWRSKHTRHHSGPNKEGVDPDLEIAAVAMTPAMASRHDTRLFRWLVARQGWYFFPLLLLEGLSLHVEGVKRVTGRGPVERRAVEAGLLAVRLGGLLALVSVVLPPEKALAFIGVELGVFGLYMGSAFAPNHIGMPLVSPRLKLDFLRRQVLTSRNISGGPLMSVFMGGLNHQVEHHLFPSVARPHLRTIAPLVRAHCVAEGVPYTETTLWQSYRSVVGYLNTVGLKGKVPFLCPLVAQRRAA